MRTFLPQAKHTLISVTRHWTWEASAQPPTFCPMLAPRASHQGWQARSAKAGTQRL